MMQRVLSLYILLAVAILTGCDGGSMPEELRAVDSMVDSHPDSALICLDRLAGQKDSWDKASRMRYELLKAKAQNKADFEMKSDSLMEEIVQYFDRHGTSNERVLAHYLLGRTYADLGQAPRAISCFKNAINAADTTSQDCDFLTLSTICSQTAWLYRQQLLLSYEINARQQAIRYAKLAKDTFRMIINKEMAAHAYILKNQNDTAEHMLTEAQILYRKHGYMQDFYQLFVPLLHILVEQKGRLPEVKRIIEQYETGSDLFDKNHELPPERRQYYYYKGRYYEETGKLDSAELCYRKILIPNMSPVQKDPMYRGLLSVFKKRHQADSIAKYAQLFCEANDSSIAIKDRELTAQMAACYNYTYYQQESRNNEAKAYRFKMAVAIVTAIFLIIVLCGYIRWERYKRAQLHRQEEKNKLQREETDRLKAQFAFASIRYAEKIQALRELDERHRYTSAQYEAETEKLTGEIETLKSQIQALERREEIAGWRKTSIPFSNTGIIKRVRFIIDNPPKSLSDGDMAQLVQTVNEYYPDLIVDLANSVGSNSHGTYVGILTAMNVSPSDITRLIGIGSSQVSNIRLNLNRLLFNEKTARTLSANLRNKYHLPEI